MVPGLLAIGSSNHPPLTATARIQHQLALNKLNQRRTLGGVVRVVVVVREPLPERKSEGPLGIEYGNHRRHYDIVSEMWLGLDSANLFTGEIEIAPFANKLARALAA